MITLTEAHDKILEIGPEEFFTLLLPEADIKQAGSSYHMNPCFISTCGHNDCMSFSYNTPTCHCFSCGTAMNYYQAAE